MDILAQNRFTALISKLRKITFLLYRISYIVYTYEMSIRICYYKHFKMRNYFSICLIGIITALVLFSCKKNSDNKTVIYQVEPKLISIAPNPPAPPDSPKNIPAMVLVEKGTSDTIYLTLNRIAGFDYIEGYAYTITVVRSRLKNPPADGDIYRYSLAQVIAKEKANNNR